MIPVLPIAIHLWISIPADLACSDPAKWQLGLIFMMAWPQNQGEEGWRAEEEKSITTGKKRHELFCFLPQPRNPLHLAPLPKRQAARSWPIGMPLPSKPCPLENPPGQIFSKNGIWGEVSRTTDSSGCHQGLFQSCFGGMELENDETVNSNEELPLKRGIEQLVEAVQGSKDGAKQVDGGAAAPEGAAAENSLGASTSSVSDGEGFEVCPPSAACALESPPPRSFSLARTVDCRSNAGHSCVLAERKGFLPPLRWLGG